MLDLGLSAGNEGTVCAACIGDSFLGEFIDKNASESECKYCAKKSNSNFAVSLEELAEFMAPMINEEWTDPVTELRFEREEGYFGKVFDGCDLLSEIGFESDDFRLQTDLGSHFRDAWCRNHYFSPTAAESHKYSWGQFCNEVKHFRRYTFWNSLKWDGSEDYPDHVPPGQMLALIEKVIVDLELIQTVRAGKVYWRAQSHEISKPPKVPAGMTAPPRKFATQPNRMSPAGIPMFYGAEDADTAILEVKDNKVNAVTAVAFKTLRSLRILDLTFQGRNISYFSPRGRIARHQSEFLRFFSHDVSRPLIRDKQQHIEYVPTQVFTEHVRFLVSAGKKKPVDGIRYFSSRNGRPCVVLFLDQEDCLKSPKGRPQTLAYVPGSKQIIRVRVIKKKKKK